MSDNVIQRAWDVIAEVRDRAPRLPNDASTDDIVNALHDAGLLAERPGEPSDDLQAAHIAVTLLFLRSRLIREGHGAAAEIVSEEAERYRQMATALAERSAEPDREPLRCSTCGQPHPCDHVRAVAEEAQP